MNHQRAVPRARSPQAPHHLLLLCGWLVFSMCGAVLGITQPARAGVSGFGGSTTYTGQLGPVSAARTICVCVSTDPNLGSFLGCLEVRTNGATYFAATYNTNTYFVVTFLDLNLNVGLDAGEPYVIYNGKSAPPGDPVVAGLGQTAINFSFGDENLWPPSESAPTATETETPTATPPPSSTATPSPIGTLERPCPGDCDSSGDVTVGEIIALVNIALGNAQLSSCMPGDTDNSHEVTIDEIVAAVDAALSGCT